MSIVGAWLRALFLAVAVVAIDQMTKALVESGIGRGEQIDLVGPLQLTNVGNTGIAFGLAGGGGSLIVIATVAAIILILAVFSRDPVRPGAWPAVGLLIGGAVGNLIDRTFKDAVTDFLDLPAWPAFNVADIAITVGVVALAWSLIRETRPEGEGGDGS